MLGSASPRHSSCKLSLYGNDANCNGNYGTVLAGFDSHEVEAGNELGVGSIVKEGFLQKRSSSVRRDWKRRWFFIRSGKLFYQRESREQESKSGGKADAHALFDHPVLVCEVVLCTARECTKPSDLRFSFEVSYALHPKPLHDPLIDVFVLWLFLNFGCSDFVRESTKLSVAGCISHRDAELDYGNTG